MKPFRLDRIKDNSLCLGCGLCEAVLPNVKMMIDCHGFIVPDKNIPIDGQSADLLNYVCPAINISCIESKPTPFGEVLKAFEGWAKDANVRFHASSGGIITALSIYLLESNEVNGIIQVRKSKSHYMHNEITISHTREDVMNCSASRYSPVSMFSNIFKILDDNDDVFAFVGKPCDIATIKRLLQKNPKYKSKIKYFISLVCAGTPSYKATDILVEKGKDGREIYPISVKYRGDGWPGEFTVDYNDRSSYKCNYNDSWGEVLGRNLNFRCKICPDGIGKDADIVVGDSWHTKNGYPDFTEKDGRSFILIRTKNGEKLCDKAYSSSYISREPMDIENLKYVQPYQHQRLLYSSYKLLAAKVCMRSLLRVSGISVKPTTLLRGVRSMMGTFKRFRHI